MLRLWGETCNVDLGNDEPEDMMALTTTEIRTALGNPPTDDTPSTFADLVSTMSSRHVALTDPTRLVAGADDLVHPMAGRSGGGVARSTPTIPDMRGHAIKTDQDDTLAPRDLRSERQVELMYSLVSQLRDLDAKIGEQASDYTARMTDAGKWTPGRGGNASDWISRMITKVRELKTNRVRVENAIQVQGPATVEHDDLIVRETKTGKPMPQYYAVQIDGTVKFYRVKAGTKPGWWWIDVQASDDFHPVRSVPIKNKIVNAIKAQGAEHCMRQYGRLINHCGRCHRTLTDETSRANGIGPECEGKL